MKNVEGLTPRRKAAKVRNPHGNFVALREFWTFFLSGSLHVVALPGHTHGHCGFYSAHHQFLFSVDLFATAHRSIHRALKLPLKGIFPCHADESPPERQLERLRQLL